MVLRKILDNRLNDSDLPIVPRAPRSIRKRNVCMKSAKGGGVCAFELLATVAGKLLEESECSSASSSAGLGIDKGFIKREPLGVENDEQGSCEGSVFFSGFHRGSNKLETVSEEVIGERVSHFATSASSVKVDCDSKLVVPKRQCEFVKLVGDTDRDASGVLKCGKSDDSGETCGDFTMTNKSPVLPLPTNSNCEGKVELSLFRDSRPDASFPKLGNCVNIGCKDDDEIVSHESQPSPNRTVKVYNPKRQIGDRKLRKPLTSDIWNTAPKLKDYDTGGTVKHVNHSKRCPYDIDRSQRNTPFKKRRLIDRSSVVTYDGGISCESVCNSPKKIMEDEKNATAWKLHEGKGISPSAFERKKSCNPKTSNVRLSIKSFKVPELFIEVPKSTTVCSLKKTVLETVTNILGGGLRVGVLLHGKNIEDDDKTLLQTGISQNDNMDSVAFMLEPDSPTQPSQLICSEDPPTLLSPDSPKFVNRSLVNSNEDRFVHDTPDKDKLSTIDSNYPAGSGGDLVRSPSIELSEKIGSDSKALVPVPESSIEALAVVPRNHRHKHCEIGQRRARRPFSVTEVEALVHAVEKLGTGRWRDVKLCSFENAKHRTYVDLKDKWKTLVHTARISPQQRRGEPVPQELLDRVLDAQSYWSDNQPKQHGKNHQTILPKLTNCSTIKT